MTKEEHLERLIKLQTELTETSGEPRNSYAYSYTRPRLIKALGQAVEEARKAGVIEEDIDELIAELEVTTERRPIELENFWDPRRMAKGWGDKK